MNKREAGTLLFAFCLALLPGWGRAEVILDGTLGGNGAVAGPAYAIPSNLGRTEGANLFFSFSQFNINTGQSATFSGPGSVDHIISRVTGGTGSWIDGAIISQFAGADFWLLNPAGVMFGANATLDVDGGFHVSTADSLQLGTDGIFFADPAADTILTASAPTAFGFLSAAPAGVTVDGSELQVADNETFEIVAGEIIVENGALLKADSGKIQLVGLASGGEVNVGGREPILGEEVQAGAVLVDGSTLKVNDFSSRDGSGDIIIRADALILRDSVLNGNNFGAMPGGEVDLRAGSVSLENGALITVGTSNLSSGQGSDVTIVATGSVIFSGENEVDSSSIQADILGSGQGGSVEIRGGSVSLGDGAWISSNSVGEGHGGTIFIHAEGAATLAGENQAGYVSAIQVGAEGEGNGGSIRIESQTLHLQDGAILSANTFGNGRGGSISIRATGAAMLSGNSSEGSGSSIQAVTTGSGQGGEVTLQVGSLAMFHGASIGAITEESAGRAGNVRLIVAGEALLAGESPGGEETTIQVSSSGAGHGGELTMEVGSLELRGGAWIGANALGSGDSGNISIIADGEVRLTGASKDGDLTAIQAGTTDLGQGGGISIRSDSLFLLQGAEINARSEGAGQGGDIAIDVNGPITLSGQSGKGEDSIIQADAMGAGDGGSIVIHGDTLTMNGGMITTESTGLGNAGNILLRIHDSLTMDRGRITTQARLADGGDIDIRVGHLLFMKESQVSTLVQSGLGNGGNIFIDPDFVILKQSILSANAFGGAGGNITLIADHLIADPDSAITASSQLGISGNVEIISPDVDLSGGLVLLSPGYVRDNLLGASRCSGSGRSSFVRSGPGGLPEGPNGMFWGSVAGLLQNRHASSLVGVLPVDQGAHFSFIPGEVSMECARGRAG